MHYGRVVHANAEPTRRFDPPRKSVECLEGCPEMEILIEFEGLVVGVGKKHRSAGRMWWNNVIP